MNSHPLPDFETDVTLDAASTLFHALSDRTRLKIVQHLLTGEHRVADLVDHLGLAQSTVSGHLACLRDCALVVSRPSGRSSLYRLKHPQFVTALLRSAESLLGATGNAVLLCPEIRDELPQRPRVASANNSH